MIAVSDHALLRFLERGAGIDIEAARADLIRSFSKAQAAAESLGVRNYAIRTDGLLFMVRSGVVTTVKDDMPIGGRFAALAPRTPTD